MLNLVNTAESSFAQLLKELEAVRVTVQQQLVDGTLDRYVRRNFIVRQFGDRLLPLLTRVMGHSSSREAGAVDALSSLSEQRRGAEALVSIVVVVDDLLNTCSMKHWTEEVLS